MPQTGEFCCVSEFDVVAVTCILRCWAVRKLVSVSGPGNGVFFFLSEVSFCYCFRLLGFIYIIGTRAPLFWGYIDLKRV
jgi:hypothetical protein